MSKIEFDCTEQKAQDLTGFWRGRLDDSKNPYKASELHDDDFNVVSGMNFVLSYLTDCFLDNIDDYISDDSETIANLKHDIAKQTIENFSEFGYSHVKEYITSSLDGYEDGYEDENC